MTHAEQRRGMSDEDVLMFRICALSAMIEVEIAKHPRTGDNVPKRGAVHTLIRDFLNEQVATLTAERDEARAYVENTRAERHRLWLKDAEWAMSCGKLVVRAEKAEAERDAAVKNQRTAGTVEVCRFGQNGDDYCWLGRGPNGTCDNPDCPLRPPAQ